MKIPEYVSVEEVKNVCKKLGIRDWSALKKAEVTIEEAKKILAELETGDMPIDLENFRIGLEVELEHGMRYPEANVTNNHPILTGKIVLAHFKETLDYYQRLEVAEIEGDLLKALKSKDYERVANLYQKLLIAKQRLAESEVKSL
ncbi:MAG: hypothetical protein HA492_06880 [Candidatus Verstraetearchaeota archaeon]|jgi:hypothetical protein|uniref:Uncharacterized protein n=1 Tax=Thermoproteota archaeon TaxID=2056631 RepID=A0A523BG49_9CREN|nr:hypothetical protein [Candidatus Verstraetearchaeota archaeon]TDA39917.1 MAG: hypothetical protein DSO08_01150 [Candidatus Verstraetearchaeota archaeon]